MEIKIFGPGCKKCKTAEDVVREVVSELAQEDAVVTKVSDIQEIAAAGVMSTPAISINGEIKSVGKIPTKDEVKSWIG